MSRNTLSGFKIIATSVQNPPQSSSNFNIDNFDEEDFPEDHYITHYEGGGFRRDGANPARCDLILGGDINYNRSSVVFNSANSWLVGSDSLEFKRNIEFFLREDEDLADVVFHNMRILDEKETLRTDLLWNSPTYQGAVNWGYEVLLDYAQVGISFGGVNLMTLDWVFTEEQQRFIRGCNIEQLAEIILNGRISQDGLFNVAYILPAMQRIAHLASYYVCASPSKYQTTFWGMPGVSGQMVPASFLQYVSPVDFAAGASQWLMSSLCLFNIHPGYRFSAIMLSLFVMKNKRYAMDMMADIAQDRFARLFEFVHEVGCATLLPQPLLLFLWREKYECVRDMDLMVYKHHSLRHIRFKWARKQIIKDINNYGIVSENGAIGVYSMIVESHRNGVFFNPYPLVIRLMNESDFVTEYYDEKAYRAHKRKGDRSHAVAKHRNKVSLRRMKKRFKTSGQTKTTRDLKTIYGVNKQMQVVKIKDEMMFYKSPIEVKKDINETFGGRISTLFTSSDGQKVFAYQLALVAVCTQYFPWTMKIKKEGEVLREVKGDLSMNISAILFAPIWEESAKMSYANIMGVSTATAGLVFGSFENMFRMHDGFYTTLLPLVHHIFSGSNGYLSGVFIHSTYNALVGMYYAMQGAVDVNLEDMQVPSSIWVYIVSIVGTNPKLFEELFSKILVKVLSLISTPSMMKLMESITKIASAFSPTGPILSGSIVELIGNFIKGSMLFKLVSTAVMELVFELTKTPEDVRNLLLKYGSSGNIDGSFRSCKNLWTLGTSYLWCAFNQDWSRMNNLDFDELFSFIRDVNNIVGKVDYETIKTMVLVREDLKHLLDDSPSIFMENYEKYVLSLRQTADKLMLTIPKQSIYMLNNYMSILSNIEVAVGRIRKSFVTKRTTFVFLVCGEAGAGKSGISNTLATESYRILRPEIKQVNLNSRVHMISTGTNFDDGLFCGLDQDMFLVDDANQLKIELMAECPRFAQIFFEGTGIHVMIGNHANLNQKGDPLNPIIMGINSNKEEAGFLEIASDRPAVARRFHACLMVRKKTRPDGTVYNMYRFYRLDAELKIVYESDYEIDTEAMLAEWKKKVEAFRDREYIYSEEALKAFNVCQHEPQMMCALCPKCIEEKRAPTAMLRGIKPHALNLFEEFGVGGLVIEEIAWFICSLTWSSLIMSFVLRVCLEVSTMHDFVSICLMVAVSLYSFPLSLLIHFLIDKVREVITVYGFVTLNLPVDLGRMPDSTYLVRARDEHWLLFLTYICGFDESILPFWNRCVISWMIFRSWCRMQFDYWKCGITDRIYISRIMGSIPTVVMDMKKIGFSYVFRKLIFDPYACWNDFTNNYLTEMPYFLILGSAGFVLSIFTIGFARKALKPTSGHMSNILSSIFEGLSSYEIKFPEAKPPGPLNFSQGTAEAIRSPTIGFANESSAGLGPSWDHISPRHIHRIFMKPGDSDLETPPWGRGQAYAAYNGYFTTIHTAMRVTEGTLASRIANLKSVGSIIYHLKTHHVKVSTSSCIIDPQKDLVVLPTNPVKQSRVPFINDYVYKAGDKFRIMWMSKDDDIYYTTSFDYYGIITTSSGEWALGLKNPLTLAQCVNQEPFKWEMYDPPNPNWDHYPSRSGAPLFVCRPYHGKDRWYFIGVFQATSHDRKLGIAALIGDLRKTAIISGEIPIDNEIEPHLGTRSMSVELNAQGLDSFEYLGDVKERRKGRDTSRQIYEETIYHDSALCYAGQFSTHSWEDVVTEENGAKIWKSATFLNMAYLSQARTWPKDDIYFGRAKDYIQNRLDRLGVGMKKPYSLEEAINGNQFMNRLNPKSASGYGIPGINADLFEPGIPFADGRKRLKLEYQKKFDDLIGLCAQGFTPLAFVKGSIKVELVSMDKFMGANLRMFTGTEALLCLAMKCFLGPLFSSLYSFRFDIPMQVCADMNDPQEVELMVRRMMRFSSHGDGRCNRDEDQRKYDKLLYLLYYVANIMIHFTLKSSYTEEQKIITCALIRAGLWYVLVVYNEAYLYGHGLPSGVFGTTVWGSIALWILYIACYFYLLDSHHLLDNRDYDFDNNNELLIYGDDCASAHSELVRPIIDGPIWKETMASFGMLVTDGDDKTKPPTYKHWTEITFLKRKFRYSDEHGAYVSALSIKSIARMVSYYPLDSDLPRQQHLDTVVADALRHLSMHPKATFYKVRDTIGLPNKSYEELVAEWKLAKLNKVKFFTYEV
jgi:hypothetical protein